MSHITGNHYELIGGAETLARLVDAFYDLVKQHPNIAPIFPDDLTETREKQFLFLTQFLGGSAAVQRASWSSDAATDIPFPIIPKRAEAWLSCMSKAMDKIGLEGDLRNAIFERLTLRP